jgi:hypothetical protein
MTFALACVSRTPFDAVLCRVNCSDQFFSHLSALELLKTTNNFGKPYVNKNIFVSNFNIMFAMFVSDLKTSVRARVHIELDLRAREGSTKGQLGWPKHLKCRTNGLMANATAYVSYAR